MTLYLIPTFLSETSPVETLPSTIRAAVNPLRDFIAENERSARRFLKQVDPSFPVQECTFYELSEHTPQTAVGEIFRSIGNRDAGLLSEAGAPCVADPGGDFVLLCHLNKVPVVPLAGSSAIVLALMASGLNGQSFAFNGYLAKEKADRVAAIKALEERSRKEGQTQIFMETPYRSDALLHDLLSACHPETLLCVACNITAPDELIRTQAIKAWRQDPISLDKKPTLFLIQRRK